MESSVPHSPPSSAVHIVILGFILQPFFRASTKRNFTSHITVVLYHFSEMLPQIDTSQDSAVHILPHVAYSTVNCLFIMFSSLKSYRFNHSLFTLQIKSQIIQRASSLKSSQGIYLGNDVSHCIFYSTDVTAVKAFNVGVSLH